MLEVMRDALQSRYLRSNVAHKQLARTSLNRKHFPFGKEPVSRRSRNFTGHFRVAQFPLYLKNGEDLSSQIPMSFFSLLP